MSADPAMGYQYLKASEIRTITSSMHISPSIALRMRLQRLQSQPSLTVLAYATDTQPVFEFMTAQKSGNLIHHRILAGYNSNLRQAPAPLTPYISESHLWPSSARSLSMLYRYCKVRKRL